MGETIQFMPSMLDAGYTVVAVIYKFSTRENHSMSLIKTSLLIQREISLQIYFFGIVYFFRYVQISSTVENDCAYTVFSFSGGRGYFQLCEFQQLRRNNQFFKIQIFLCSVFQFKIFDVISRWFSRMRWFSLWYSSNLPFSPRLDRYSRWQVFFFQYFFFCSFFEQFSFFQNSYPTTISCFWFNNPMTEE